MQFNKEVSIPVLEFKKSTLHKIVNQVYFLKKGQLCKNRMGEFWLNEVCQDCDKVARKLNTTWAISRDV